MSASTTGIRTPAVGSNDQLHFQLPKPTIKGTSASPAGQADNLVAAASLGQSSETRGLLSGQEKSYSPAEEADVGLLHYSPLQEQASAQLPSQASLDSAMDRNTQNTVAGGAAPVIGTIRDTPGPRAKLELYTPAEYAGAQPAKAGIVNKTEGSYTFPTDTGAGTKAGAGSHAGASAGTFSSSGFDSTKQSGFGGPVMGGQGGQGYGQGGQGYSQGQQAAGDAAQRTKESAQSAYNQTADRAGHAAQQARDTAGQAYGQAADSASRAADQTKQAAGQAYGQAADTAGRAADRTKEMAGQAYGQAADTANRAADRTKEVAGQAYNQAADTASRAADQTMQAAGQAYDQAADVASRTADKTKEMAGQAADTASYAADRTKEAAGQAYEATAQTAQQALDKLAAGSEGVLEQTKEYAAQAQQLALEQAQRARENIGPAVEQGKQAAADLGQAAAQKAVDAAAAGQQLAVEKVHEVEKNRAAWFRRAEQRSEARAKEGSFRNGAAASPVVRKGINLEALEDLVYWRHPPTTAATLGAATIFYLLLEWSNLSLLRVASLMALFSLTGAFLWNNMAYLLNKPDMLVGVSLRQGVSRQQVQELAEHAANALNNGLNFLYRAIHGGDVFATAQVAFGLWLLGRFSRYFSAPTLAYLAVVAVLTLPKLYKERREDIHRAARQVRSAAEDQYHKNIEPIVEKLPTPSSVQERSPIELTDSAQRGGAGAGNQGGQMSQGTQASSSSSASTGTQQGGNTAAMTEEQRAADALARAAMELARAAGQIKSSAQMRKEE